MIDTIRLGKRNCYSIWQHDDLELEKKGLLQLLPNSDNFVVYNTLVNSECGSVVQNIKTEVIERRIAHPIYDVEPEREARYSRELLPSQTAAPSSIQQPSAQNPLISSR